MYARVTFDSPIGGILFEFLLIICSMFVLLIWRKLMSEKKARVNFMSKYFFLQKKNYIDVYKWHDIM